MTAVYTISSGESDDDCLLAIPICLGSSRGNLSKGTTTDSNCPDEIIELASSDQSNAATDDPIEKTENGVKRKSKALDEMVDLPTSNHSDPDPDVDMEPTDNVVIWKGKGKGKKTSLEKQNKKQKLEEEKLAKKAAAEKDKFYRPGECMKYMNIEGHPSLWERWYMSDVAREAAQHGTRIIQAHTLCDPSVIVWSRTIPRTLDTKDGQVKLSPQRESCDYALYITNAEEISEMVSSHTLSPYVSRIRQLCACNLTLVLFGVNDYFKKKGGNQPFVHRAPSRKTCNSNRTPMTEIELELAIVDLLVTAECDTAKVNTANELALTIIQFTKAIAEAPFKKAKRACDDQAAFYMKGDNKNCVAVDKDGAGVDRLWQQMIAVLPQSSLETSRAICAKYKSPLELYESLQAADGVSQLARTAVSRGTAPGGRRLGPDLARKLHTLFTASSGDTLIH